MFITIIISCILISIGIIYAIYKVELPIPFKIAGGCTIIGILLPFMAILIQTSIKIDELPYKYIKYDYKLNIVNDSVWLYSNDKLVQSGKYDSLFVLIERDNL